MIAVAVLSLAILIMSQNFAMRRNALLSRLLAGIAFLFVACRHIGSVARAMSFLMCRRPDQVFPRGALKADYGFARRKGACDRLA